MHQKILNTLKTYYIQVFYFVANYVILRKIT